MKSSSLFNSLSESPFPIRGSIHQMNLFRFLVESIIEMGEKDHSGDWDPYLIIHFKDGSKRETESGLYEISYGDLSIEDDREWYLYPDEISSVGFLFDYSSEPGKNDNEEFDYFPLASIESIRIMR